MRRRELERLSQRFPEYRKAHHCSEAYLWAQYRPLQGKGCLVLWCAEPTDRCRLVLEGLSESGLSDWLDVVLLEQARAEAAHDGCMMSHAGVAARIIVPTPAPFCGAARLALDWCRGRSLPALLRGINGPPDGDVLISALNLLAEGMDFVGYLPPGSRSWAVAGSPAGILGFSNKAISADLFTREAWRLSDEAGMRTAAIAAESHGSLRSLVLEDESLAISGRGTLRQRLGIWKDAQLARRAARAVNGGAP